MKKQIMLALLSSLLAPIAAGAEEAPDAAARSRIVVAEQRLREQAGTVIRVKAERAARIAKGSASDADIAAIDAERIARGLGETREQIAEAQAGRYAAYLAGRARLDGVRARALRQIATGEDPAAVLAAVDAEIAAILAAVPGED